MMKCERWRKSGSEWDQLWVRVEQQKWGRGGGPQGQFHPITTAHLDKGEAQKESKGRRPRMNKLYAPDSFNFGSESCFELTWHLQLGYRLCRLNPQPPVYILHALKYCFTSDTSHREPSGHVLSRLLNPQPDTQPCSFQRKKIPQFCPSLSSLLLSHFDCIDNNRDILPSWRSCCSSHPPDFASWRCTVMVWPWPPC